jgi:hypothetical protein
VQRSPRADLNREGSIPYLVDRLLDGFAVGQQIVTELVGPSHWIARELHQNDGLSYSPQIIDQLAINRRPVQPQVYLVLDARRDAAVRELIGVRYPLAADVVEACVNAVATER